MIKNFSLRHYTTINCLHIEALHITNMKGEIHVTPDLSRVF